MRRLTAALLGLTVAACGGTPDAEKVRTIVERFGAATAAKDYEQLCDELLAPALVEEVERVGLPCEGALRRALGEVEAPTITIGAIEISGDAATAEIRTAASGERPSRDELELVRFGDGWRVASLN